MHKDKFDIMSDKELFMAQQFAQDEILSKAKDPHDNNFITRCWLKGILRSLKKSGYTICLKKKDLEIGL
jgi:hypothetical protein